MVVRLRYHFYKLKVKFHKLQIKLVKYIKEIIMSIHLENRDYTLIIDKSGSMVDKLPNGDQTLWQLMQETTFALANECEQFDPDGITIYIFSTTFQRYDNVTASKVKQIFRENGPAGRTETGRVLADALQNYFQRREQGQAKIGGETIVVVTDGQADHPKEVIDVIISATKNINRKDELAISFVQIGNDPDARKFLKTLDNDLLSAEARFDIVNTVTFDEIEEGDISLKEVLIKAMTD